MSKIFQHLAVFTLAIGTFSSCHKSLLPSTGHDDPNSEIPIVVETDPPVLTPVTQKISTNILGYYSGLPAHYFETKQTYPLMIFFHGGGQYGNGASDLYKVLQDGVPKLLDNKTFPPSFTVGDQKFSFIILAPQFVRRAANSEVDALVTYAKNNFRVDPSRIYLVGFSLGARQAGDYAAYKPSAVAALTSMGGLIQLDSNLHRKCQAMVDANLPIWQFHNRDDSAWYYIESKSFVYVLNSFNPAIPPRFTTFEIGEARLHHDCWTKATDPAYKEDGKNIYEWMLGYKR